MIYNVMPVFIVTGGLGSGKTTLINRALREPGFRDSAVLVNEFGEIGIDHRLVASASDTIRLLDGGCLCCMLAASLRETLIELYQLRATGKVPRFTRVVVETSGLADPVPLMQTLLKDPVIAQIFALAGLFCVVDAVNLALDLNEMPEISAQIALADRLLIAKHQLASRESLESLRVTLAQFGPAADQVLVPAGGGDVADLLSSPGFRPRDLPLAPVSDHPRHDSTMTAQCFRIARPVDWAGVAAWTGHLRERYGATLLRCKALLSLAGGGRVVVQGVRGIYAVTRSDLLDDCDDHGVVTVIGRALDRAELDCGLSWLATPAGTQFTPDAGFAPWRMKESVA